MNFKHVEIAPRDAVQLRHVFRGGDGEEENYDDEEEE